MCVGVYCLVNAEPKIAVPSYEGLCSCFCNANAAPAERSAGREGHGLARFDRDGAISRRTTSPRLKSDEARDEGDGGNDAEGIIDDDAIALWATVTCDIAMARIVMRSLEAVVGFCT